MSSLLLLLGLALLGAASGECDFRFYGHYEHKGCRPVFGIFGCPLRFACRPQDSDVTQRCLHAGRWYLPGQEIQNTADCEKGCRCEGGGQRGAFIACPEVECPDWEVRNSTCHAGYHRPTDCCRSEICPQETGKTRVCEGGYRDGEPMPDRADPCTVRMCDGGTGTANCRRLQCMTGALASDIRRGCLVLYAHAACCAYATYCGEIKGATPVDPPASGDTHELCEYRGLFYGQGAVATLAENSYGCVECRCSVPPDLTCVRKPCSN